MIIASFLSILGCAAAVTRTSNWDQFIGGSLPTDDVRLYTEEYGEGDPILMVHGIGANMFAFRHLTRDLSAKHRIILVDLKGCGKSPKPCDGRYSVYDHARLICDVIKERDLRNLTIVGHSFGGSISLLTALYLLHYEPQRLKRLVLIDTAVYEQRLPFFIQLLRIPLIGELCVHSVPARLQISVVMKMAFFDTRKVSNEMISTYVDSFQKPGARYAAVETARQLVPADGDKVVNSYGRIFVPTLIIWGREDRLIPLSLGQKLNATIPGSRIAILDECGHIPHEEKPEETSQIIRSFLENAQ